MKRLILLLMAFLIAYLGYIYYMWPKYDSTPLSCVDSTTKLDSLSHIETEVHFAEVPGMTESFDETRGWDSVTTICIGQTFAFEFEKIGGYHDSVNASPVFLYLPKDTIGRSKDIRIIYGTVTGITKKKLLK